MVHVRKFNMRYKKTILLLMVILFVSCGGGSGSGTNMGTNTNTNIGTGGGNVLTKVISTIVSDSAAVTMIPVGY
jgi:hypothetical protein